MTGNSVSKQGAMYLSAEDDGRLSSELSCISPAVSGLWFDKVTQYKHESRLLIAPTSTAALFGQTDRELLSLEKEMSDYETEFSEAWERLQSRFVIEGLKEVSRFLRSHRSLIGILAEVAFHLTRSFGIDASLRLAIRASGDEQALLRASVSWPGSLKDAEDAMQTFDGIFWLENCRKASGNLIVVYDLV